MPALDTVTASTTLSPGSILGLVKLTRSVATEVDSSTSPVEKVLVPMAVLSVKMAPVAVTARVAVARDRPRPAFQTALLPVTKEGVFMGACALGTDQRAQSY